MIPLAVSVTSQDWNAVKAYVLLRSAELTDLATSTTATDAERRDAVMRLDELRTLLAAPQETHALVAGKFKGDDTRLHTY